MAKQGPQDWTVVKLVKDQIAESDEDEYQGVTLPNFDSCLKECNVHVLADLCRVEEKIKHCLKWSDTKLLQSILMYVETQSWIQKKGDGDEEIHEMYLAVNYIISIFLAPLEARGLCVDILQDEVHEAVEFARKYLPLGQESYSKIWYKPHLPQLQ